MKKIILWTILFSLVLSCTSQLKNITNPKDLEEGIKYFERTWSKYQLEEFRHKDERKALADVHFSAALWVRNNWVYGNRNKKFKMYFNNLGVFTPDDISSILFISLHRRLNGKDIELDKQVESYKKYWHEINNCEQKQTEQAKIYYNHFKIADTINVFMPVDTSSGSRSAVIYMCPTEDWDFNILKDLKFKAIILDKYYRNSNTNIFFKLKILKMNFPKTQILMEKAEEGREIDLNLKGLKIE